MKPVSTIICVIGVLLGVHQAHSSTQARAEGVHPCDSEIYCYGPLLHTVQMNHLFKDSKTFVDMKLKQSPEITLNVFEDLMKKTNNTPSVDDLKKFVKDNFDPEGSEFEPFTPNDWVEYPKFLDNIKDADFKQWASDLNSFWKKLGRKMKADVEKNPQLYSIIHVPNPVIVPGGRFREFYYWDSYWIVRGLLYSEMYETVKGMLDNFLLIIDRFGFIPNGGRIYYAARTQPPLLTGMIKSYVEATNDIDFIRQALPILEREFYFFKNNHMVDVKGHSLAVYGDKSTGPRPESYREDVEIGESFSTEEERQDFYSELKAGAESGMDYTSRWFINSKNGTNEGTLRDLKTRSIVAVDLNAILFWNAKLLAEFSVKCGNATKAAQFEQEAQTLYNAIQSVLWNDNVGAWLDYDLINNKQRNYFVPTNLFPLWVGCYNTNDRATLSEKVLRYVNETGLDKYPGGVPNTLADTNEQWDYPNVWPPMQYVMIEAMRNLGSKRSNDLAFSWAQRWVRSNFIAYQRTQAMFEKYSAEELGGHGGGGEYEIQLGFGWTNGVVLELLDTYGDRLTSSGRMVKMNVWTIGLSSLIAILATVSCRLFW